MEPLVATLLRSRLVDRPWRFALRELGGAPGPSLYRVRDNGLRVAIVHRTPDVNALDQAFYQHAHEPPAAALAVLQRLGRPIRALDVGANVGMWGLWLHGRLDVAHVTGLEPDPENVARHRRLIALNGRAESWDVLPKAATVQDGPVRFILGAESNGRIVPGEEPRAGEVEGVDLFGLLGGIDLLKLDIEGGEWTILDDPRFAEITVPVVTIEFHPDGAPGIPREVAQRALERAGYVTTLVAEGPPGFGVWWGHRT